MTIECLPWHDLVRRYDGAGTLFYLDPPYWGNEGDYGKEMFRRSDFAEMARTLAGISGRFLLSINDTEGVRETFSAFRMTEVATTYSIAVKPDGRQSRRELLISNYRLT